MQNIDKKLHSMVQMMNEVAQTFQNSQIQQEVSQQIKYRPQSSQPVSRQARTHIGAPAPGLGLFGASRPQSANPGDDPFQLGHQISSDRSAAAALGRNTFSDMPMSAGLTTHVWPKSRMLFAIVSKMSKEGVVNDKQRGILKDLILEHDPRMLGCLANYEAQGDRDKLYGHFIEIANSVTD